jgi:hypothetical protein
MKMLIGSDLPIFGDEQHPAVSLRLRYFKSRLKEKTAHLFYFPEI